MMVKLKDYKFSISAAILGSILVALSFLFDIDFFEFFIESVQKLEKFDFDELFVLFALVFLGIALDFNRFKLRTKENEKKQNNQLHVFRITMVTVTDIVFNAFHVLRLLQYDFEKDYPDNPKIKILDEIITKTTKKIKALSMIEKLKYRKIGDQIAVIDYDKE